MPFNYFYNFNNYDLRNEYFGKYGKITKVSIGVAPMSNSSTPTHTAFIHFMRMDDALRAIQSANNLIVDGRLIRASLGTTKYCSSFLRGMACQKSVCCYILKILLGIRKILRNVCIYMRLRNKKSVLPKKICIRESTSHIYLLF